MNEIPRIRSWQEALQEHLIEGPLTPTDRVFSIRPVILKEVKLHTMKRFNSFCNFNSAGDWGIGLGLLLDIADNASKKGGSDYLEQLEMRIAALESFVETNMAKIAEQSEKKAKTFGGGERV